MFAAVFPGQGAQSVGMLGELAAAYPVVEDTFTQASKVLTIDLWAMTCDGPSEVLARTQNTQPLLLTASVAAWRVWRERGGQLPDFVAGHSLGEYSAIVCAQAMSFEDAVRLVRLRGELMEAAVPAGIGAMAAIMGLTDDQVEACCEQVDGVVVAANYNAPGQVVIAGEAQAVEAGTVTCKDAGAKRAVMLDVSGPFHSPLMEAAKDEFGRALADVTLSEPVVPVVQNVAASVPHDVDELRRNLLEQIAAPVRWSDSVSYMTSQGVSRFIECGPGSVLAGLIKRTSRATPTAGLGTPDGVEQALAAQVDAS